MKIAFVTFNYYPHITGGSGIYAARITKELAKLGQEVVVFTPNVSKTRKSGEEIDGVHVVRIEIESSLPYKAAQFWLRLPRAVAEAEEDHSFDLIHLNSLAYWMFNRKLSRAPQITTIHHLAEDAARSTGLHFVARNIHLGREHSFLFPLIEKSCITNSTRVVAVSEYTKKRILEKYGISDSLVAVISNGIDAANRIVSHEQLEEFRRSRGIPEGPIVLFVGRLDDPRKGAEDALIVMSKLVTRIAANLVLVGSGSQDKLRRLSEDLGIQKRIHFAGYVDDSELQMHYALCDVYLCTSKLEGFGLTVQEAITTGKPIVATRVGAIPELVQDGVNGFLVSPEMTSLQADRLFDILTQNDLRLRLSDNNRRSAIDAPSWRKAAELTLGVYRKALGQVQ